MPAGAEQFEKSRKPTAAERFARWKDKRGTLWTERVTTGADGWRRLLVEAGALGG